MRSRLTACKLLLIAPVLFLMLQVSLALHHHHTCSYHDGQGCFHGISTSIDKQAGKIDFIIGPKGQYLPYCPLVTGNDDRFQISPEAVVFTTPSHSRAPPTTRDQQCRHRSFQVRTG
jgi:hypothetical protein